ncbi:hypothetical protein [Streptomyces candidus]|uniref:Uncharacterized protein n=1 Tax=Streptomyces candidus TaxID=67283 RepID=A0A7X0LSU1_9ACTN|nr:hypothetical protein [Streptomyces candidus]MBB6440068.1 hypothetical protein [Streptomyces candidus]GHH56190.1 hypothetical protein GCM10018773_61740 [Streptomyces candidus]
MAHSTNGTPPDRGPAAHLPTTRRLVEDGVELLHPDRTPHFAHDLVRSLDEASQAVGALRIDPSSDVTVSALTALVCTGTTWADALQAAADVARTSPGLEPHALSLARVPGPVVGLWEYQLTMTVSSRDPQTGDDVAPVHHGERMR